MNEAREFRTAAVLSAVTPILLCPMGELYELLSFLVGRSVFTHEIPAAMRLASPSITAEHPELIGLDLSHVTPENWSTELALLEARFGVALALHPVGWNTLAEKSPIDTAVELFGKDRVIAVESPAEEAPHD